MEDSTMKTKDRKASPEMIKKDQQEEKNSKNTQLMQLFEDELKDIYWAEKALTKAIPKMIDKASNKQLIEGLENHLKETEEHVTRLEKVFESIDKEPTDKKCEAMAGLIEEAEEIMKESESGAMCDAGIITAAQKVEHYEIASYGSLRTFARTLGFADATHLLEETLNEEKAADEKLTEVARGIVNEMAASRV